MFDHIFNSIKETDGSNKETTLLLAGDIDVATMDHEFIEEVCKHFKYVLRICGNHEFYDQEFFSVIKKWQEFEESGPKNFHFLHNDSRILDGVRFLGGTMWTSFDNGNLFVMNTALNEMIDYQVIKLNGRNVTPEFIANEHKKFMDFLEVSLAVQFDGPTVIMTHHSPGNPIRRGDDRGLLDHCYFADKEAFIGWFTDVKLWVHGHIHQPFDYVINETRVVCNPYGYWNRSINVAFNPNLILEI
jgi:predicted phosphodiesterase